MLTIAPDILLSMVGVRLPCCCSLPGLGCLARAIHKEAGCTLPLRPLGSVQPFLFMASETPMRFFLTTAFLMDSRPCFLMSVFLPLATTTLRAAGARLLSKRADNPSDDAPDRVQLHNDQKKC